MDLDIEMRKVLMALSRAAGDRPGEAVRLRRVAITALRGDEPRGARELAELDARGYVRTDTMGWLRGWVTEAGRAMASQAVARQKARTPGPTKRPPSSTDDDPNGKLP